MKDRELIGESLGDVADRVLTKLWAKRVCKRCGDKPSLFAPPLAKNALLMRNIAASGASLVHWRCQNEDCGTPIEQPAGGYWIPHSKLQELGIDVESLPVADNASTEFICEKCAKLGAEIHHWAPKHIFGAEADDWPTSPLCVACHLEWHKKTGI